VGGGEGVSLNYNPSHIILLILSILSLLIHMNPNSFSVSKTLFSRTIAFCCNFIRSALMEST